MKVLLRFKDGTEKWIPRELELDGSQELPDMIALHIPDGPPVLDEPAKYARVSHFKKVRQREGRRELPPIYEEQ